MKKLTYISPDFFFDVDFPVLKHLSNQYLIVWHAILPNKNPRFTELELSRFCKKKDNLLLYEEMIF